MGHIHSYANIVMPAEALRPLFRSSTIAKAFGEKLIASNRLATIGCHGRLVFRPAWWRRASEREDRGSVAQRLARLTTGDELFELLRDCTLTMHHHGEDLSDAQTVWNNYMLWFNEAAEAKMPFITSFRFAQPSRIRPHENAGRPRSGLHVVYDGNLIYSLRLTSAGVALGEVLGERPILHPRS